MESEDEDPFCYRSLKRIKTSHEQTVQSSSEVDVGGRSAAKKNFKQTSNKKTNKKTNKCGGENQKRTRPNTKTKMEIMYCSEESLNQDHNTNHKIRKRKETDDLFKSESDGAEQQLTRTKPPDTTIMPKASNEVMSNTSITTNPTEKHSQKTCMDYSGRWVSLFQNDDTSSFDACLEQDSARVVQTETGLIFSEEVPSETSHLPGKNGSKKVEQVKPHGETTPKDSKEGRCPFCQMPFQALHGQSPNWHTMECMDVPIKTTQEFPAGLKCDSTVPSHYRRYTHCQLALHFAVQRQEGDGNHASPGGPGIHSSANQVTVLPVPAEHDGGTEAKRALPAEHQLSKKTSRRCQRKQSPSKSKKVPFATGRSLSPTDSQGSQNSTGSNGSIKAYFSPRGKKTAASHNARHHENSEDRGSEITFDPVFKLLVISDSDSDESADDNSEEETPQSEMHKDEVKCQPSFPDETKHASKTPQDSENTVSVMEDVSSGFIMQEPDDIDAVQDSADAELTENIVHCGVKTETSETLEVPSDTNTETNQNHHISYSASTTMARTSAAPFGIQKQTSLFSFFKPHCHSANFTKQGPKGVATTAPKLSITQNGSERGRGPKQAVRKPPLTKSVSEPLKWMQVPSPPQNNAIRPMDRQRLSGASQSSSVNVSSSFKNNSGRQCPFYKRLPGTSITVDAFNYGEIPGCQAYVLTHFHYDHYQGLRKQFSQPMYCSQVTGNLVERQISVHKKWINRLPMNQPCQVAGVWLTLMEANHCPGAVIILFELPNGKKLLHTGDFRADPCMEQYPPLVGISVDELYLDTTYCDPAHAFPSQRDAIQFAVSTALKTVKREPGTLIVCGAYTIGKERIFIALAEALQTKICVQPPKKRVLDCLEDPRLKDMVSLKWTDGCVHVLPMRQLNSKGLEQHLGHCPQFSSVLAFEPTGWTHSNKTLTLDNLRPKFSGRRITVYGVPYSEHSSYLEMKRFVQFLRPKKILPTVNNGNATSRKKMEAIFRQWLSEKTWQANHGSANNTAQPSLGAWLGKPS